MQNELARVKKAYDDASPEDQEYAKLLLTWLAEWLEQDGDVVADSGPGDHPPPPPPHP